MKMMCVVGGNQMNALKSYVASVKNKKKIVNLLWGAAYWKY